MSAVPLQATPRHREANNSDASLTSPAGPDTRTRHQDQTPGPDLGQPQTWGSRRLGAAADLGNRSRRPRGADAAGQHTELLPQLRELWRSRRLRSR
jgi:hypothetical protein